jgi:hypothetical protein
VCDELEAEVRQALDKTGVTAVKTTLEEFECDEPEINAMRRKIALQQEQVKLEVVELENLVNLLGADHVRMERALAEWVKARVPQIISGADGNIAQGLLQVMPFTRAREC